MGKVISEFGNIVGGGSSIQLGTMPTYTDVSLGTIVQYIGATNANYTNGYFYKRGASGWENVDVQEGSGGDAVFMITLSGEGTQADPYVVDKTPAEVDEAYASGKCIQLINTDGEVHILKSTYEYDGSIVGYLFAYTEIIERSVGIGVYQDVVISKKVNLWMETSSTWEEIEIKQGEVPYTQVSELRVVGSEFVGTAYQYMGTTNGNYIHGCFYECVPNGLGGYQWQRLDVQPSSSAVFTITLTATQDEQTEEWIYSVDKTPAEVEAAYNAGKVLQISEFEDNGDGEGWTRTYSFDGVTIDNGNIVGYNFTHNVVDEWSEERTEVEWIAILLTVSTSSTWEEVERVRRTVKPAQVKTMPPAAQNEFVQYIGTTTSNYTHGYFYESVSNGSGGYTWQRIDVQPSSPAIFQLTLTGSGTQGDPYAVDKTPAEVDAAIAAGKVIKLGALTFNAKVESNNTYIYSFATVSAVTSTFVGGGFANLIRSTSDDTTWTTIYTTNATMESYVAFVMQNPSASLEGKVYQYVGPTNSSYTNGYFYKCVSDGATPPTYSWQQINVQPMPDIIQYDSLPTPNESWFEKIIQLTTDGQFYRCTGWGESGYGMQGYYWEVIVPNAEQQEVKSDYIFSNRCGKSKLLTLAAGNRDELITWNSNLPISDNNVYCLRNPMDDDYYDILISGVPAATDTSTFLLGEANVSLNTAIYFKFRDSIWFRDEAQVTKLQITFACYHGSTLLGEINLRELYYIDEYDNNYPYIETIGGLLGSSYQTTDNVKIYAIVDYTLSRELEVEVSMSMQEPTSISSKADKVANATNGNFAALNASGNLTDSGKKASDFVLTSAIGTAAAKDVPTSGDASSTQVVMGNDSRLSDSRTPTAHNQAASTITAGTLAGRVQANATAAATLSNAQVRDVTISTTDLTPNSSSLAAGSVYIVYE